MVLSHTRPPQIYSAELELPGKNLSQLPLGYVYPINKHFWMLVGLRVDGDLYVSHQTQHG